MPKRSCDYKYGDSGFRCGNRAVHGLVVFTREQPEKWFCRDHWNTVRWLLDETGESYHIIGPQELQCESLKSLAAQ